MCNINRRKHRGTGTGTGTCTHSHTHTSTHTHAHMYAHIHTQTFFLLKWGVQHLGWAGEKSVDYGRFFVYFLSMNYFTQLYFTNFE